MDDDDDDAGIDERYGDEVDSDNDMDVYNFEGQTSPKPRKPKPLDQTFVP